MSNSDDELDQFFQNMKKEATKRVFEEDNTQHRKKPKVESVSTSAIVPVVLKHEVNVLNLDDIITKFISTTENSLKIQYLRKY
jgi:hypothetical protein